MTRATMQMAQDYLGRIKELEKENNKLLDVINNQDVKIADLEKENAELGEQLLVISEQLRHAKEMPYSAVKKFAEEKTQEQLTKAKEHIRTLISCLIDWVQEDDKDYCYIADAEQFLKEIEK